jgi:hypothetical protein
VCTWDERPDDNEQIGSGRNIQHGGGCRGEPAQDESPRPQNARSQFIFVDAEAVFDFLRRKASST